MFKGIYYKNKYVHTDTDGFNTLYESNITFDGREFFMFKPTIHENYEIYLKDEDYFLNLTNSVVPLREFLIANNYTPIDFINPIGRTQKIINEINKINKLNKPKIKKK